MADAVTSGGWVERCARALEAPLEVRDAWAVADAIVVLGVPLRGERLSTIGRERVDAAVALWRAGAAPRLCVTGGRTAGAARSEADVMAAALERHGVPTNAIVVEPTALHTAANAAACAALLLPRGWRHVWLVTQPFHSRRARRLFRRAGFEARAWHVADSVQYVRRERALRWIVREYGAWVRGVLPGR